MPQGQQRPKRRWGRRLLLALVAFALLLVLAYVFRQPLFGGLVARLVEQQLARTVGGTWDVGPVGGSWLADVSIEEVRLVEPAPDGVVQGAALSRVSARYDLLGLIRGRGLAAVHAVRATGRDLELDFTKGGPRETAPLEGAIDLGPPPSVPSLPDVHVEADVGVRAAGVRLEADTVRVTAEGNEAEVSIEGVSYGDPSEAVEGSFGGRLVREDSGALRWESETSLGGVALPRASWGAEGEIEATVDTGAGTLEIATTPEGIRASTEAVDVAALPGWVRAFVPPSVGTFESGRVSGQAVVRELPGPAGTFDVEIADLRLRRPEGETLSVERLAARGRTTTERTMRLERLEARATDAQIDVEDASLDFSLPWLVEEAERIAVRVDALSTWIEGAPEGIALALVARGTGPGALRVATLDVATPWGRATGEGDVTLAARPEDVEETTVDLDLDVVSEDLGPFLDVFEGSFAGDVRTSGSVTALGVALHLEGRGLRIADLPVDTVDARTRLAWPDLVVEELRVTSPVAEATAAGRMQLTPYRLYETEVQGRVPDVGALAGRLGLEVEDLQGEATIAAVIAVDEDGFRTRGDVALAGVALGGTTVGDAQLDAAFDDGRLRLHAFEASGDWGRAKGEATFDVAAGEVALDVAEASGDWGRVAIEATADLEEETARLIALEGRFGDVPVVLEAPLEVAYGGDTIRVTDLRARIADGRLAASARVDLEARRATLEDVSWASGEQTLRSTRPFVVDWSEEPILAVEDLALAVGEDLRIRGQARANLEEETATVEDLVAEGDFGTIRLTRPLRIRRDGGRIAVEDLAVAMDDLRAEIAADVFPDEGRAAILRLQVQQGDLEASLERPATFRWKDGLALEDLVADVAGASVRGRVAQGETIEADLAFEDLALSRFAEGIAGVARGDVRLRGETGRIEASVEDLAVAHLQGDATLTIEQDEEGGLRIPRFGIRGEARGSGDGEAGAPEAAPAGRLDLEGEARLPFRVTPGGLETLTDAPRGLRLQGTVPLPPTLPAGPVRIDIEGVGERLRGRVSVEGRWLEGEGAADDIALTFEAGPDAVTVDVDPTANDLFAIEGRARLDEGLDWADPTTWSGILDAPLSGRLVATLRSWGPVGERVAGLRHLEGAARVVARVSGTPRRPEPEATLLVRDLGAEFDGGLPGFSGVTGRVRYADRRLDIEALRGLVGYGPFTVDGHVALPEEGPPEGDVRLEGRYLLLARGDGMRMRADVDLHLAGTWPDDTLLSGSVRVADLLYVKPFELTDAGGDEEESGGGGPDLFAPPGGGAAACVEPDGPQAPPLILPGVGEPPFSKVKLDVAVEARETIRVRMNLAHADIAVDGRVGGTLGEPEPEGTVTTRDATVYLPTTTLVVEGAELTFPPGDVSRPRVAATVRTRASGYMVGASAQGTLPNLEVGVWSRPQLPPEDAFRLLATGGLGGGGEGAGGFALETLLTALGDNLLSFAKGTADAETRPIYDRFTLNIGRETSQRGQDTVEGEVRLVDRLHFRGERDRYDETNFSLIWRIPLR